MSGHNALEAQANSEYLLSDPGNAKEIGSPIKHMGVVALVSAAAETRTLAAPERAGLQLTICLDTDGGDVVVTASAAVNVAGNNTLTFADARDKISLKAISVGGVPTWSVESNDGVALSTV